MYCLRVITSSSLAKKSAVNLINPTSLLTLEEVGAMHWVTGFSKAYYALYREGNVISGLVNAVCVCLFLTLCMGKSLTPFSWKKR